MYKNKEEFFKRWNVTTKANADEEYGRFLVRISNVMRENQDIVREISIHFCQIIGIEYYSNYHSCLIHKYIFQLDSELEFFFSLQVMLDSLAAGLKFYLEKKHFKAQEIERVIDLLLETIHFSDINLTSSRLENGQVILHPRGEKLLDEKLVDQVLSFLDQKSQQHFVDSLKFYSANNAIKSAESLRRCLEEFLRFKLGNTKGLTGNIPELQTQLKSQITKEIRTIIFDPAATLKSLDSYFNENSKHRDGDIDEAENEFLIYQVGTVLRYISKSLIV